MNTLSKWMITYALVEDFDTEYPREAPCLPPEPSIAPESDACCTSTTSTVTFPEMDAFTTIQFVAIISIDDQAQLSDRSIGIKATSIHGLLLMMVISMRPLNGTTHALLMRIKTALPDNFPPACDSMSKSSN